MANQITYTDKVDLNETEVADINKVKASDLNEIKSVVNGISTELTNLQTFSTNEVKTNKRWINGKPIYRKTIYISSLPNASSVDYQHEITNVESIWADMSNSFIKWADGQVAPLPYVSLGSPTETAVYSSMIELRGISKTKFTIATGFDRRSLSAYITLNYTKTTD